MKNFITKFKAYSKQLNKIGEVKRLNFKKDNLTGDISFEGMEDIYFDLKIDSDDITLLESTKLLYVCGREAYQGDLFKDDKGNLYRIYKVRGGFACSTPAFKSTLTGTNPWPLESLSDDQSIGWFESQAIYVGNIFENKDLIEN